MAYGMFEMQREDENDRDDAIAIMSGNMCAFCLSTLHAATTADDCPRNVPCLGCDTAFIYLNADQRCDHCHAEYERVQAEYWADQEGKPDFTCSHCKREFFTPNEGWFPGNIEPETLCVDCSLKERGII